MVWGKVVFAIFANFAITRLQQGGTRAPRN